MALTIKDLYGKEVKVTDLNAAIQQAKWLSASPYKSLYSGLTIGEYYKDIYNKLKAIQQ